MSVQGLTHSDFTTDNGRITILAGTTAVSGAPSTLAAFASQYHEFQVDNGSPPLSRRTRRAYDETRRKETAETRSRGVCSYHKKKKTRCTRGCEYRQLPETAPSHTANDATISPKKVLGVRALAPKPQISSDFENEHDISILAPSRQYHTPVATGTSLLYDKYVADQQRYERRAMLGLAEIESPSNTFGATELSSAMYAVDASALPEAIDLEKQVPERQNIILNKERSRLRGRNSISYNGTPDATRAGRLMHPMRYEREKRIRFDSKAEPKAQQNIDNVDSRSGHNSIKIPSRTFDRRSMGHCTNSWMPLNDQNPDLSSSLFQSNGRDQSSPRSSLLPFPTSKPIVHDPRARLTAHEALRRATAALPATSNFGYGVSVAEIPRYIDPARLEYKSDEISQQLHCAPHSWNDDAKTEIFDENDASIFMSPTSVPADGLHDKKFLYYIS